MIGPAPGDVCSEVTVEGYNAAPSEDLHVRMNTVGPDYFKQMQIPLRRGRDFSERDNESAPLVAIVNETFVRRFVPGGLAIGRHLALGIDTDGKTPSPPREVVGVMRDVKTGGLGDAALATPEIYVPHEQAPIPTMFVAIRTTTTDPVIVLLAGASLGVAALLESWAPARRAAAVDPLTTLRQE